MMQIVITRITGFIRTVITLRLSLDFDTSLQPTNFLIIIFFLVLLGFLSWNAHNKKNSAINYIHVRGSHSLFNSWYRPDTQLLYVFSFVAIVLNMRLMPDLKRYLSTNRWSNNCLGTKRRLYPSCNTQSLLNKLVNRAKYYMVLYFFF